jgi:hypothetical protein
MDRLRRFIDGVSFGRGLALGALVGAAIAGSTIWSRLRSDRVERDQGVERQLDREKSPAA